MKTYRKISRATSRNCLTKTFTVIMCCCTLIAQHALGQFADDFTDRDFTNNPMWTGSSSDFIINASDQLQLNNSIAGTSNLVVPFSFIALGESEWRFNVRHTFQGSSGNFGRVYLMSDQQNLLPSNGYYLQFGEAGSNDAVELFRQTGTSSISVCRAATIGGIAATSFNITVKVNRSVNGFWEMWVDYAGGSNFILEASGTDNTHVSTSWFGVRCVYTVQNATKFFYDNFVVSAIPAPDVTSPVLSSVTALSQTEAEVLFSEPVNASAETEANYAIADGTINPITAVLSGDQKTVKLTFAQPFVNGVHQTLSVANVSDLANNLIVLTHRDFLFFQPLSASAKDILITEIFPDFSPAEGLPEAEFVELFNRSPKPFDLSGWRITDGTAVGILSSLILLPGEYLILSLPASQSAFSSFGKSMGVPSFPSLNNSGDAIRLKEPGGMTIDSVNYSSAWYNDDNKKDGGWTLERIDPENFCKGSANWTASMDVAGGTPGKQNSVFANIPDVTGPKLLNVSLASPTALMLEFDEKLSESIPAASNFSIDPAIGISAASFTDASLTKISLDILSNLDSTLMYTVVVTNVKDCPGNDIQNSFSSVNLKLDTKLPEVKSLAVLSSTSLEIIFSEKITEASAQNGLNYEVVNLTSPAAATLSADQKTVTLIFAEAFVNGVEHILHVRDVFDRANNQLITEERSFTFFQPSASLFRDIIITEIFSDPSPQKNLPETEFIELYNRSNNPFDLNGWTISDGSTTGVCSKKILLPGEYLILCAASKVFQFSSYGNAIGATTFPSLNNTGDGLVLKEPGGATIDSVNYSDAWYMDDEKKDGGWTMELIDPMNICSESENWTSSEDDRGGTPGAQNSVFANKPDLTSPELVAVIPLTPSQIEIRFNEKLEKNLPDPNHFIISPSLAVTNVSFTDLSLTTLHLNLDQSLQGGVEYNLTVNDILDCSGNKISDNADNATFALPEQADSLDVVINEILFNPRATGVDFVEVYNRSAKFINLKNWVLANRDAEGNIVNNKIITEEDFLLKPQRYLVFTEDGNVLKGEYLQGKEEMFFETDLPSFPDDEGSVVVADENGKVIDAVSYTDKMHSVFIKDDEGVSLERIVMEDLTNDSQNWKSASSVSGYATPGYLNSNAATSGITDEVVAIEPEIFMPLYGQPDFTQIKYHFDQGGYVANIKIFDPHGREIKQLANNEILGTEGFFRWDGDQNNGGKVRIGSYMVWFEVFDDKGTVRTFRKRVVVADKF